MLSLAGLFSHLITGAALTRASRAAVGVFLGVFVPTATVRKVAREFKAAEVAASLWGNDLLKGKPLLSPGDDGVRLEPGYVGQVNRLVPPPINCQKNVNAPIALLGSSAGPSAIIRFVIAVIVYAVKRVAIRAWPHVGKEIAVSDAARNPPPVAYGDSSRSVVRVERMRWPVATVNHPLPQSVKRLLLIGGSRLTPVACANPFNVTRLVGQRFALAHEQGAIRSLANVRQKRIELFPLFAHFMFTVFGAALDVRPSRPERMRIFIRHFVRVMDCLAKHKGYSNAV